MLHAARRVLVESDNLRQLSTALREGTAEPLRIGFVVSVPNWGLAARLRVPGASAGYLIGAWLKPGRTVWPASTGMTTPVTAAASSELR